jgi:hypothetical protein
MKNVHPLKAERRRQRRLADLRTENPCCPLCGETALECLEVHEIAGFSRDADAAMIVCRNCHRKLHTGLLDAGILMVRETCPLERTAQCMRALAVTMRAEADALDEWANSLDLSKREDQHVVEPKS